MESASPGDWQEKLAADSDGSALKSLREQLARDRAVLRRDMDSGASPEAYAVSAKLAAAVDAAESAATAYWEKYNR
ncbi:MAG: hypothetical protein LBQ51_03495 [Desulfovibrio sp.]|jgi:hypothetical protein|nr:hypothetical protein [Desulfovibrio sp.]